MTVLNALGNKYPIKEVIGEIKVENSDTAVVFLGGIHGNEPSGYMALCEVFGQIQKNRIPLKGDFFAYGGNIEGLKENRRFIQNDLNRIWLHKNIDKINSGELTEENAENEWRDFIRLYQKIKQLLNEEKELIVIDLHTTSAPSIPFITINDMIKNRNYSRKFPVPIVIGIEEYLNGPLLSYMNEYNHISMAFEAGQHTDVNSILLHESFVWLAMMNAGIISKKEVPNYSMHIDNLTKHNDLPSEVFEVRFKHNIQTNEVFKMNADYYNFKPIEEGEILAKNESGDIVAIEEGRIFMPLYQKEGDDGFFIIRKVPAWALSVSKVLRGIRFENILRLLPGVRKIKNQPHVLEVDTRIAKFLSIEIFHLLGYRRKSKPGKKIIFSRREIVN